MLDKFKLQIQELEHQNEENKSKHNRLQKNSKSRIQALEDQLRLKKSTEKQEKHFDWTNFNKICYLCGNKFDKGGHQRVILVSCGDQFGRSCLAGMHAAGDHQCPTCSHVFRARGIKKKIYFINQLFRHQKHERNSAIVYMMLYFQ